MSTQIPSSEKSQAATGSALERADTAGNCYHYPTWRKWTVVAVTSWMTLAATFSSTSLLSAANEIASDFSSTVFSINASSAGVLLAMGLSSFLWGPIGLIAGKRIAYIACAAVLLLFTIGVALAPNMPVFVTLRVLSGLQGTYFHVAGQTILATYFPPVERGTATGFFLAGTVLGPPLGPCIAGIVVTYQNWRVILWLQAGMIGLGVMLSVLFIRFPEAADQKAKSSLDIRNTLNASSPLHVFRLMANPSILLTDVTCGLLSWSQYSLISAPRHIISNRFHLTSPLYSGLFYISPAMGYLIGTLIGGRYSDKTVKKWIIRRDGTRLPQDRLNSGMWSFFLVVPAASMAYGWGLVGKDDSIAWLALPVISAFFMGAGLLVAFASLNTYCAEVRPDKRMQVIAGKYCIQYTFAALGSGTAVPLIDSIGVGPSSTIGAVLVLFAGSLTMLTAKRSNAMQDWMLKSSSLLSTRHLYNRKWHAFTSTSPT